MNLPKCSGVAGLVSVTALALTGCGSSTVSDLSQSLPSAPAHFKSQTLDPVFGPTGSVSIDQAAGSCDPIGVAALKTAGWKASESRSWGADPSYPGGSVVAFPPLAGHTVMRLADG